jgi:chloramphenicol O-acetyltransferase
MKQMSKADEAMLKTFARFTNLSTELVEETKDPLIVAASAIQLGMMIYKTVLPDEDYNKITDHIHKTRDSIPIFQATDDLQLH